ncbi:MAG: polysaccharide biosynthesis/export family protein [Paludibacteraceae bacterium]|nr:polysaccharide biosynthesis/export family protein [Paludibacteraceae bacterium]
MFVTKTHYIHIFSLIVLVSSCITSEKVNYMQPPGFNIPSYKDSLSFEDYRLRSGDRLFVKVYSTDEKTNALFNGSTGNSQMMMGTGGASDLYTYLVNEEGAITFPMIGDIFMAGKSVREATTTLEKAIEPLFRFSTVEMRVVNRNFSVIGGGKSGYYTMPREKINVFQALAMAGDVGLFGDRSKIRVLRETEKGTVIKSFDVRSADIVQSEFFYIEPNDVIYIQTLNEQFFSVTNLPSLFSTVISTFSFGVLMYDTYKRINPGKPAAE